MTDPLQLIRARRAEIAQARKALDAEDAELQSAEKTVLRLSTQEGWTTNFGVPAKAAGPHTQRELVVATLRDSENLWFDSVAALRDEIERVHGRDIKITSLQPLVSMMTGESVIKRNGSKVGLAARVGQQS